MKNEYSVNSLASLSLAYLLIPTLIFLLGWYPWYIALPVVITSLLAFAAFVKQLPPTLSDAFLNTRQLLWTMLAGLFLAWLAGIGGFAWQRADFIKHDLIFHDLIQQTWPVVYQTEGQADGMLSYYVGWYLVPSLFGTYLGQCTTDLMSLLWSAIGICLTLHWWIRLAGASLGWAIAGLCLFAGMDVLEIGFNALYESLVYGERTLIRLAPIEGHLPAVWGLGHRIPAAFHQLAWTPQHALGGWVATALIWELSKQETGTSFIGWIWALVLIHSPLVAIGLIPFAAIGLLRHGIRPSLSWINLGCGGSVLGIMAHYFLGHAPVAEQGFVWETATDPNWWLLLPIFLLLEYGLLVFILATIQRSEALSKHRLWLWTAFGTLSFLALYRLGWYNDLFMRASIPAMMVVGILALQAWVKRTSMTRLHWVLAAMLLLGSIAPAQEHIKSLVYTLTGVTDFRIRPIPPEWDIRDVDRAYQQQGIPHPFPLAPQYLGRVNY